MAEKRALSFMESSVRRRQTLLLGGALLAVAALAVGASLLVGGKRERPAPKPETKVIQLGGAASDKDAWRASEGSRLEVIEKKLKELDQAVQHQMAGRRGGPVDPRGRDTGERGVSSPAASREPAGAGAEAFPPSPSQPFAVAGTSAAPPPPRPGTRSGVAGPAQPGLKILTVASPSQSSSRAAGDAPSAPAGGARGEGPALATGPAETYLPAGSFMRAVLLNGVDAPTGGNSQQNPMPVLMQLVDDAQLPNAFRSAVKGCFVLGDAHGDLSSERVLIRLNRMSCVDESGGALDVKVAGYVTDETGRVGVQGTLVTKSGQVLANALFTGVLSGIGKGIQQSAQQQNTTITGAVTTTTNNPWQAGIGEGIGKAFQDVSQYYLKLADKLFPVVSIDGSRSVDVILARGVSIERKQPL